MENKYTIYDQIDTNAIRWLKNLKEKHSDICLTQLDKSKISKWMLCIARTYNNVYGHNVYICTNFFNFLYLKFIKHFTFLKRFTKHTLIFPVVPKDFAKELTESMNLDSSIINCIYDEYYNRSKKNG